MRAGPTMHSTKVRTDDFEIFVEGEDDPITLPQFLPHFTVQCRVGIIAPRGTEGSGAALLILAMVTAFYNCLRSQGDNFFAYPDFYVFQSSLARRTTSTGHLNPASYAMLDVWPDHKLVTVARAQDGTAMTNQDPARPIDWLHALCDRAINIVLLPDSPQSSEPVQPSELLLQTVDSDSSSVVRAALHSFWRNVQPNCCFAYDPSGRVNNFNTTLRFAGSGPSKDIEVRSAALCILLCTIILILVHMCRAGHPQYLTKSQPNANNLANKA